jgi:hypothetical protein
MFSSKGFRKASMLFSSFFKVHNFVLGLKCRCPEDDTSDMRPDKHSSISSSKDVQNLAPLFTSREHRSFLKL